MRNCSRILLLCVALWTVSGPAIGQESYSALVKGNTRFAFSFFRQAVAEGKDTNVLISPTAISLDFALLQNGAGPVAKAEILDVFNFGHLSSDQINHQGEMLCRALSYIQPQLPKGQKRGAGMETGERLIMARSLWVGFPASFKPAFLQTAKQFYAVNPVKLPADKKAAAAAVNSWAAAQTGGKLTRIVNSVNDHFLLLNTTWFKGIWLHPFSAQDTHPGDFTLLSRQRKSVPMMSEQRKFVYLEGPKFQAVRLDYWYAGMFIFLPDESSSLSEFEESLTPDNWVEWSSSMRPHPGYLELPRFSAAYRGDVKNILARMGLGSLFQSFGSFAPAVNNPQGAALSRVLQVMMLNVDEKGTEIVSGGVPGGVIGGISAAQKPEEPFRMIINRPFFFAIVDNTSHAILYMGAVVEP